MRAFLLPVCLCIGLSYALQAEDTDTHRILRGFEDFILLISSITVQEIADTSAEDEETLEQLEDRLKDLEKSISKLRKAMVTAHLRMKHLEIKVDKNAPTIKGNRAERVPPKSNPVQDNLEKIDLIGKYRDQAISTTISNTINEGSKLYNKPYKDHDACHSLYENRLNNLIPKLPADLQLAVKPYLNKAATQNTDDGCFTLRKGIDLIEIAYSTINDPVLDDNPTNGELRNSLRNFINWGAHYFNGHNKELCYQVYKRGLLEIRPHLDQPLADIVSKALKKADSQNWHNGSWTMRAALDKLNSRLKE